MLILLDKDRVVQGRFCSLELEEVGLRRGQTSRWEQQIKVGRKNTGRN